MNGSNGDLFFLPLLTDGAKKFWDFYESGIFGIWQKFHLFETIRILSYLDFFAHFKKNYCYLVGLLCQINRNMYRNVHLVTEMKIKKQPVMIISEGIQVI